MGKYRYEIVELHEEEQTFYNKKENLNKKY